MTVTGSGSSTPADLDNHLSRIIEIFQKNNVQIQDIPKENIAKLSSDLSNYFTEAASSSSQAQGKFEDLESEFLTLLSDERWSEPAEREIESQFKNFFTKNPNFLKEWTNKQEYPLTTSIIEDLNYRAFGLLVEQLKKDHELFQKQLVSIDNRNWNIYHWFVNGLVQKSSLSQIVGKEDLELLKKIDQVLTENFPARKLAFLKDKNLEPRKMLEWVYELESSAYYEQIREILS